MLPEIRRSSVTSPGSGVSDGGAFAISSAFGQIAHAAARMAQTMASNEQQSGMEDARKAFDQAAMETPAGEAVVAPEREGGLLDRLGVRDESYANMISLLTIQRGEEDARTQLAQLRQEAIGNPTEFQRKADAWIKGYIQNVPGDLREDTFSIMSRLARENLNEAMIERRTLDIKEARQATNTSIQRLEDEIGKILERKGITGWNTPEVQERLAEYNDLLDIKANDPGFVYSEEERDYDLTQFQERLQIRAVGATITDEIRDALDYRGVEGAKKTLETLMTSEEFDGLPRDAKEKLQLYGERVIQEREREIKAEIAEARARRGEFQSANYMRDAVSVLDGKMTRAEIDQNYARGEYDAGHYLSLVQSLGKKSKKQDDLIAAQELFQSGVPVNPADTDHKKAAALVFEAAGGADLMKENPAAGLDLALSMGATKGIVPEQAVTVLRGLSANGSAEQQGYALDSIARLLEEAPAATRAAFKEAEIKEAVAYREMASLPGAPEDFAISSIIKAREEKFSSVAAERRKVGEKTARDSIALRDTMNAIDVGGLLEPRTLSGGEPALEQANATHRRLYAEFFSEHGNADLAGKQAAEVLKKSYGVTRALGRREAMMYPPEAFYSVPGVSNDWMKKQIVADVSAAVGEEVSAKSLRVISDAQTAAEAQAGMAPTYVVVRERDNGILEAVQGRFMFDPSSALAERDADLEANVERAAARRDKRLERQQNATGLKDLLNKDFTDPEG